MIFIDKMDSKNLTKILANVQYISLSSSLIINKKSSYDIKNNSYSFVGLSSYHLTSFHFDL